jgi:hypothetical protein
MAESAREIPGLLVREVDGEILMLDTESDLIHRLNRTASVIWRLYNNGSDVEGISESLAVEFGLDHDRARKDVLEALGTFRQLNLVR